MTTFKEFFLLEEDESRTKEITRDEAIDFARTYCTGYMSNGQWLYRGMKQKGGAQFLLGDSTTGRPRVSVGTPNYYTVIMDNLPSWSHIPKRSKSFICTSTPSGTSAYGQPYFILVPDNTKVTIAPSADIWSAFERVRTHLRVDLDTFATLIKAASRVVDTTVSPEQAEQSWTALKQYLEEVIANMDQFKNQDEIRPYHLEKLMMFLMMLREDGVVPALEYLFEFDAQGFELQQAHKLRIDGTHEVWFAGPAVFVNGNDMRKAEEIANEFVSTVQADTDTEQSK